MSNIFLNQTKPGEKLFFFRFLLKYISFFKELNTRKHINNKRTNSLTQVRKLNYSLTFYLQFPYFFHSLF